MSTLYTAPKNNTGNDMIRFLESGVGVIWIPIHEFPAFNSNHSAFIIEQSSATIVGSTGIYKGVCKWTILFTGK